MFDTNRPAFLERNLVGLSVDSNWQVWVRYRGGEPVPIHAVGKGAMGFSTLALAALKNFASVSCILLLRKATVFLAEIFIFVLFHLYNYVLAMLTCGLDDALVSLR